TCVSTASMRFSPGQATAQAVKRMFANPGLQRLPRFQRVKSLLDRLNRRSDAGLIGKGEVLVGPEHAVDDRSRHSGCHDLLLFPVSACRRQQPGEFCRLKPSLISNYRSEERRVGKECRDSMMTFK